MSDYIYTPNPEPRRPRWFLRGAIFLVLAGLVVWGLANAGGRTISMVRNFSNPHGGSALTADVSAKVTPISQDTQYAMPKNDGNIINILIMGMQGEDQGEDVGPLLTDTILLFSVDKTSGLAAMTSIPRDLTLRVTNSKTEKINTIYTYQGLAGSKELFSRITGVYIDNIVIVDFTAFKDLVDQLGGVNITLDKPFTEDKQFGYTFSLPKGTSLLTGQQALYFVRSRYSTSDFDRARRQQQMLIAIKDKVQSLHLDQDPLKALQLLLAVKKNITTDLNIFDLGTLKTLMAQGDQLSKIKRYQLTTDNVLYETTVSGSYELLPRGGNLDHIHDFFRSVLSANPVMWTPSPSPTPAPTKKP